MLNDIPVIETTDDIIEKELNIFTPLTFLVKNLVDGISTY